MSLSDTTPSRRPSASTTGTALRPWSSSRSTMSRTGVSGAIVITLVVITSPAWRIVVLPSPAYSAVRARPLRPPGLDVVELVADRALDGDDAVDRAGRRDDLGEMTAPLHGAGKPDHA